MQPKYLTTFWHMNMRAKAYASYGDGPNSMQSPDESGFGTLYVNVDQKFFGDVLGSMVHELFEFSMAQRRLSFRAFNDHNSYADRLFVLNHQDFDKVSADTGDALAALWWAYDKEWRKRKKQVKDEAKRRKHK